MTFQSHVWSAFDFSEIGSELMLPKIKAWFQTASAPAFNRIALGSDSVLLYVSIRSFYPLVMTRGTSHGLGTIPNEVISTGGEIRIVQDESE